MKKLSLLGSTGSIGSQTLDVVKSLKEGEAPAFGVAVLAARSNVALLETQMREYCPEAVAVFESAAAKDLRDRTRDLGIPILEGPEGLCQAAAWPGAEITLNAVVGMIGLRPTLAAVRAKRTIALANKETLVAGGKLVMEEIRKNEVQMLPVDSEHSAIFQCLQGCPEKKALKKLILTASGGPFFGKNQAELRDVTPAQALRHPNWSMGAKITIDSATLMNKGLEVIEASWLFDMPPEEIEVVVHRESIVHSLIEYQDNSVIAQLGLPDMRVPIQYALTFPKRCPSPVGELKLWELGKLTFCKPDFAAFRCLPLCIEAAKRGGVAPAVVNGANEKAVELFLQGQISFLAIPELVELALEKLTVKTESEVSLEAVLWADQEARRTVEELVKETS